MTQAVLLGGEWERRQRIKVQLERLFAQTLHNLPSPLNRALNGGSYERHHAMCDRWDREAEQMMPAFPVYALQIKTMSAKHRAFILTLITTEGT